MKHFKSEKIKQFLKTGVAVAASACVMLAPLSAEASQLNPHWYATVQSSSTSQGSIAGMYWVDPASVDVLSSSSSNYSIQKEGWLGFNVGGSGYPPEWIEAGYIKGYVASGWQPYNSSNAQYIEGIFEATNTCINISASQCSQYVQLNENIISGNNHDPLHSFIIRNSLDNTSWDIYVDGTLYQYIYHSAYRNGNQAAYAELGIENADAGNSWTNGTYDHSFWYVDPSNQYSSSACYGWVPYNASGAQTIFDTSNHSGYSASVTSPVDNGAQCNGVEVTSDNIITFNHN